MKIAICTVQVPFIRGGAEILSETLHKEMMKRGYDVELVNVPFKWYPPMQIVKSTLAWRLLDLTESNGKKIDLLICTKFPSYMTKHPNKVAWIFHQHRAVYDLKGTMYDDVKNFPDGEKVRQMIINMDNSVLVELKKTFTISKNVSGRLKRHNNVNSEVLYPPLKNEERYHGGSYGNYILSVSRLDALKRHDLLIKAMKYVKTDVKCKIAGTGPTMKDLVDLTKKLKLEDKVEFLGYVDDEKLYDLYADSLTIYFAPFDEDYGYVTIESFRSKKSVITSNDSGGPLEFVDNGISGFITANDPIEIAEKIDILYNDRGLAEKMGNAGYKKIDKLDMTWDNVIKKLVGE